MGPEYLIDTNVVIDYISNRLPSKGEKFLDNLPPVVSVITRIEMLGWFGADEKQLSPLTTFLEHAEILPIDELVILTCIKLRQQNRIKLPDALIAATAMAHKLTLITRNLDDFKSIDGLKTVDLWNP